MVNPVYNSACFVNSAHCLITTLQFYVLQTNVEERLVGICCFLFSFGDQCIVNDNPASFMRDVGYCQRWITFVIFHKWDQFNDKTSLKSTVLKDFV